MVSASQLRQTAWRSTAPVPFPRETITAVEHTSSHPRPMLHRHISRNRNLLALAFALSFTGNYPIAQIDGPFLSSLPPDVAIPRPALIWLAGHLLRRELQHGLDGDYACRIERLMAQLARSGRSDDRAVQRTNAPIHHETNCS